ncbi:hypothetical protein KAX17_08475 [Candidatus Bipolaricaulota bacterium]|nr:hypothetical protein [Candidatus Bipolaricaulota bacterium]MCK4599614.1 hypothetical protein [Candidatus Bipolaricaulota bacterium]
MLQSLLAIADLALFALVECVVLVVFVYSIYRFYIHWRLFPNTGWPGTVKRGKSSWNSFLATYGIVSVLVLQTVGSVDALKSVKVLISFTHLLVLLHLFLFNAWFKNALLGAWRSITDREETC